MSVDIAELTAQVDRALARVRALDPSREPSVLHDAVSPEERVAALLVLLTSRENEQNGWNALSRGDAQLFDALRRRSLPWDGDHAAFALDTVRGLTYRDFRVSTALRGGEIAVQRGSANVALYDAVHRVTEWLEETTVALAPLGAHGLEPNRRRARRLLSRLLPAGVLDLSFIVEGDGWGGPARDAARRLPADEVEPFVRLLRELGHRTAPKTWISAVTEQLTHEAPRALLHGWLALAAETPETADPTPNAPPVRLFAPGNDDIVRAAVLAARVLPAEHAVSAGMLGTLALRGATTRPGTADPLTEVVLTRPGSPESLALKVAGAAIDTLGGRGRPEDIAELERLLDTLTRRDLVKRVGALLGPDGVARAETWDRELKRAKAAAVRAKADPTPRIVRAEIDRRLRAALGPTLRELGFRGSGRTWRRTRADHVQTIGFGSSGGSRSVAYMGGAPYLIPTPGAPQNILQVTYGVTFDAARLRTPLDPQKDRDRTFAASADIHVWESDSLDDEESLARLAERLRTVIAPFLDEIGRPDNLRAVLDGIVTPPPSSRGEPQRIWWNRTGDELLGALALAAGDLPEAHVRLTRFIEHSAALHPDIEFQRQKREFWQQRLDATSES